MKLIEKYTKSLKPAVLLAGMAMSSTVSANLINADFSDGLNGWGGQVYDYNLADYLDLNLNADFQPLVSAGVFTTGTGSVTLASTNDYNDLYLFQNFTFDANASAMSLDFFHTYDTSNGIEPINSEDIYSVSLFDQSGNFLHDFLADNEFSVGGFAGQSVELVIQFDDWNFYDSVTVSNISIESTPVPEPSSLAIFTLGLIVLARKAKQL